MDAVRAFLRHPSGMAGLVLLIIVLIVAITAPVVFPVSPWEMSGTPFAPPGEDGMWLGGDTLGRDVAAGVAHGARVSLLIGIASALAAMTIGVVIGAISGYFGGKVDLVLMRVTELFQTVPAFILAILLVATFSPSLLTIILTIGAVSWPPLARLTRAEFLRLRGREFVEAALCQGESTARIVLGHILPNAISPILVVVSLTVATAILLESALSFMGLGDPNLMSWGFMIGAGRTVIRQAWWMSVFPGARDPDHGACHQSVRRGPVRRPQSTRLEAAGMTSRRRARPGHQCSRSRTSRSRCPKAATGRSRSRTCRSRSNATRWSVSSANPVPANR